MHLRHYIATYAKQQLLNSTGNDRKIILYDSLGTKYVSIIKVDQTNCSTTLPTCSREWPRQGVSGAGCFYCAIKGKHFFPPQVRVEITLFSVS